MKDKSYGAENNLPCSFEIKGRGSLDEDEPKNFLIELGGVTHGFAEERDMVETEERKRRG